MGTKSEAEMLGSTRQEYAGAMDEVARRVERVSARVGTYSHYSCCSECSP